VPKQLPSLDGRRIALIVDHPNRDLAGLALVAWELCRRGATCFFVPLNLQDREIWALAPDFVLLNYLRRGNDELARRMRRVGIRFGVLDTEGGVWPTPDDYSKMFWTDRDLLAAARPVCMWGPRLADHLVERGLVAREQVAVTGCPRFDFYHPSWRSVVALERPAAAIARPCLLLNTRNTTVNGRFASEKSNRNQLERVLGWPRADVDLLVEAERGAIDAMIGIARRLAVDYPSARVVLRPHPFEDPGVYRRGLKGILNATVDGDGPVQPVILDATVVIQRGCTTAIEASLAGVPTLSPQWVPIEQDYPVTEAVSAPCADYDALCESVGNILSGGWKVPGHVREATDGVIAAWFHRVDGQSYLRVADAIDEVVGPQPRVNIRACRRNAYGLRRYNPLRSKLSGLVRYLGGLSTDFSFRAARNEPYRGWEATAKAFDASDIRALAVRVVQAAGRDQAKTSVLAEGAHKRGDYHVDYAGHAVTLAPTGVVMK
jgi:surface carbohydrate biosynthesis protein